jgi:hypothetical protein
MEAVSALISTLILILCLAVLIGTVGANLTNIINALKGN